MDVGKYWVMFKKDFEKKYFDYLINTRIKSLCSLKQDEFFSSPHVMLYGNDVSILKLYVDSILSRILQKKIVKKSARHEVTTNNNKHQCPYSYSDVHIEVDMEEITCAERQFISDFISRHIASTKSIYQQKHIVVIHNAHSMSEGSVLAIRKPLEQLSNNIIFIFSTQNISSIDCTLKSRCMLIRCNTEIRDIEDFFEFFIEENEVQLDQFVIDPYDGIIYNLLRLSNPNVDNNVHSKMNEFIEKLLEEKNIQNAYELVRAFGYKILHLNIPFARFMRETICLLSKKHKYKKYIRDIVMLSAELELKSKKVSKQILVFEKYYMEIYRILTMR